MRTFLFHIFLFISTFAFSQRDSLQAAKINSDSVYTWADEMPSFPGGEVAYSEFIRKNFHWQSDAELPHATIWLSFIIEKDGSMSDLKISRSSGVEWCDKEALRVFSAMPKWEPGSMNGKPVRVQEIRPLRLCPLN